MCKALELFSKKMTESYAKETLQWKYEHPYDFYNNECNIEAINELLDNEYFAIVDENDEVIGFYCIGKSALVPKGNDFGVYDVDLVDIGLGIRPDFTGNGHGSKFFKYILENIQEIMKETSFRLTVAKFNSRAIKVYEKFDFVKQNEFYTDRAEFITMVRK